MLFESMLVIAALLLIMSGGAKWVDSGPTVGALRAARLPSSRGAVRTLALAEIVAGSMALVLDHPAGALAVVAMYSGFAGFVAWALQKELPIQSCGCFGRDDTPPTAVHVAVNLVLAASAAAAVGRPSLVDRLLETPLEASGSLLFSLIAVYLLYLILAELPATMAATRRTGT
jgi:hypothetical protein